MHTQKCLAVIHVVVIAKQYLLIGKVCYVETKFLFIKRKSVLLLLSYGFSCCFC